MKNNRRDFIKTSGMLTAGLMALKYPAFSHGFLAEEAKSIKDRGAVTTYLKSKNELQYIGMPVGGIACGCVYLGGDGRLWLWDIFNKNQTGVIYKDIPWHEKIQGNMAVLRPFDGANYVEPVKDVRPLDQGFAIKAAWEGKTVIKHLLAEDWDEIAFEATYPMATIRYTSSEFPVEVALKVYSPFIPLDEVNSGLPATVYTFHLKNKNNASVNISVTGWLENKAAIYTAVDDQYTRVNQPLKDGVTMSVRNKNWADDAYYHKSDYGNLSIFSLNPDTVINTAADLKNETLFDKESKGQSTGNFNEKLSGSVNNSFVLAAGAAKELNYAFTWYFPNLSFYSIKNEDKRFYAKQFKSSAEVGEYVMKNFAVLSSQTQAWCDAWYQQSTLPWWFLERTFLNTSTLATTTAHRFSSGRFYAWEGVGSCAGTCTHVWQYAQAMARIFPALERDTRERVDLGFGFHEDGHIGFRAEYDQQPAIDGQAGRVLGIYREHQMSKNDAFLRKNWLKTRLAIEFILKQDRNGDGMVDSQLENTLDAKWPGAIAWLVGLCVAAVKAGELMAEEMGDHEFALTCKAFAEKGKSAMEKELFNGEYFIHQPDPKIGKTVLGSYDTCHIDQVYGQAWAYQVGIQERIIDTEKTKSALKALWKYNFITDVGPYLKTHHGGRPYALPGEGGMLMNTNPKNDPEPFGVKDAWQVTYFHECMSGFEHQVAAHMIAEGMTDEGLLLIKTIHDRYHAAKRNPFNEVECSDHYARAMASYGAFITASGFEYHGPKGYLKFAPKITPENFRSAFTAAEGWGTYGQKKTESKQNHSLEVKYGALKLKNLCLEKIGAGTLKKVMVLLDNKHVKTVVKIKGREFALEFEEEITIPADSTLMVEIY